MQKIVEKTEQNVKILNLIPAEIMEKVPAEKKEEFQWGILFFLQKEEPALYQAFAPAQEVSAAVQQQLVEKIRQFEGMMRERHKKQIEQREKAQEK